jgi:hypothetical protein
MLPMLPLIMVLIYSVNIDHQLLTEFLSQTTVTAWTVKIPTLVDPLYPSCSFPLILKAGWIDKMLN